MRFIARNIINKVVNKDVTHLNKKLEDNLMQLEENIFYSQQMVAIGSWTHNLINGETFWSDEVSNILECSFEDLNHKLESFYPYIHPCDRDEVEKEVREALQGKEYDIQYRVITPSGVEKYLYEKTKILYDEDNNPIKVIGIIQDITKQKLIENNLKEFGENLNQGQVVAGVGSWKYNTVKDAIFLSEEVYRIYGINPINFKKDLNSLLELIHPEDKLKIKNAIDRCLDGKAYKLEYRIIKEDGSEKYVATKGEPLFNEDGQVIGILGAMQDITENKLLQQKLEKSNKILSRAESLGHVGSWELDIIQNKLYFSDETYRIYGIAPEEYDGTYEGFLKLVYPDDVEIIESMSKYPPKGPVSIEFRVIRSDGSIRNVYQRVEFIFDEEGSPIYVYGTIHDITEKKELGKAIEYREKEIQKIQKRFQVLVQESNDVFEIITPDGVIKYISASAEKIIGYKPEERIDKNAFEFFEGEELRKVNKMVEFVLNNPSKKAQGDILFKAKGERSIYLEVIMQNLLHEPAIEGIVVNFRDITRRIEMEKRMAYISTHDELTDLPNSVYFKKQLRIQCEHAKQTNTKFALLMLDINGLKNINYSLGYELGCKLIKKIVQRLKGFLGEERFLCRYSEDHFAIIIEEIKTKEEYGYIASGLINLFLHPYKLNGYELDVGVNIGICIYSDDLQSVDSFKKHAKLALLRAKKEGKNIYKFYSSDIDIQNYKEFILRSDLHSAINNKQLQVHYQPIVNIKTNEILGAEALLRWEHPEWGVVSPDEFIPLAEETRLIIDIGKWVLKEVCNNYKKWLKDGLPNIKVSINFSCVQFLERDFVKNIKSIIDEFGLNPKFLIMEITENILIQNTDKFKLDIKNLRSYGIQLAIDDFGTGFSSLSYLNSINMDILKLDRSFIENIPSDDTCSVITKTVIKLAKELNIKSVVEGIENQEQLSYLKHLNCFAGQGFIYSKPIPLKDFERILAKGRCKPIMANAASIMPHEERRKFFRIKFTQLLESELTVLEIKGKKINVGNTKVLVKDIGPGGLCFISNIKFPVEKGIVLQFTMQLVGKEIKVYGHTVWVEEIDNKLYEYGVEFTIDENERADLIGDLNQIEIRIRKNILFAEGNFISGSHNQYFGINSIGNNRKPTL